jgi:putative transposase
VLLGWLSACCDLYNGALQERKTAYARDKTSIGYNAQCESLTDWRDEAPEAAAVPAWVQRSPLKRVDLAFKAFFRRVKAGEKPGYPRWRSKRRYDSFTVPAQGRVVRVDNNRVSLPKLPGLRFHQYRPLKGRILTATVRRDPCGKWWVSFACDLGAAPAKVVPVSMVGIDVGLKSLAVTSDWEVIDNPRHAATAAAKLARAQRILARRKRGSRSRERARVQVARCHRRVANQRLDTARKVAVDVVGRYDVIAHEDLAITRMVHGNLARSIHDAGWGVLLHAIACKAESAGKHVVAVDPRGTSQRCSGCGGLVPKDLATRTHDCSMCGLLMDRDHNAAVNICALGRSAVTQPLARAA